VARLKEAKAAGRKVIYISMGTVITGDSPEVAVGFQWCSVGWAVDELVLQYIWSRIVFM
jgi:hypothetical protein